MHAGVWLKGLPIKSIDHVVSSLVAEPTEDDPEFSPPMLNKKIARLARHAPPLGIFVYGAELSLAKQRTCLSTHVLIQLAPVKCDMFLNAGAAMATEIPGVESLVRGLCRSCKS